MRIASKSKGFELRAITFMASTVQPTQRKAYIIASGTRFSTGRTRIAKA